MLSASVLVLVLVLGVLLIFVRLGFWYETKSSKSNWNQRCENGQPGRFLVLEGLLTQETAKKKKEKKDY